MAHIFFLLPYRCLFVACVLLSAHCHTAHNKDYNPSKPHHRPYGFVNRYTPQFHKPSFFRWQWQRWRDNLPKPPKAPIQGIPPNLDLIQHNTQHTAVTWVGHATLLVQIDGRNILTDPQFSERASPVSFAGPKRHQPPGLTLEQLPVVHAVLISHNHYDHLDLPSIRSLMQKHAHTIRFYVPLGVQYWMHENVPGTVLTGPQQNVFALDWDESASLQGQTAPLQIMFLAVQHWSARGIFDRFETLWGSWAVLHPSFRFWFSGDLGYSQDTQDIGRTLGFIDLAAISIGAYEPRWFMRQAHLNPSEAIQVMKDVRAHQAVGIHWGTFENLTDEPLDEPPQHIAKLRAEHGGHFFVLKHGETWFSDKK